MKRLLLTLILGCTPLGMFAQDDCADCCEIPCTYLFEFTTGYRQDQLKIHVSPPTADVPVISTNNFKDVDIFQFRMCFKAETMFNTYSRAFFNYGRLVQFQHLVTSPTLTLDPSDTHHEKGRVYDTEYVCGFSLYLGDCFRFTPIGGYSYHRQEFESHNRIPRTEPLPFESAEGEQYDYFSVISKQRTTWQGPTVGVETEFFVGATRVCLNGQYIWAHYNNHGHDHEKYNQTIRYKQRSNGDGWIFNGEIAYAFLPGWEALLTGGYQFWDAKGGRDQTKLTTVNPPIETKSSLESVSWQSYEISLGIGYIF